MTIQDLLSQMIYDLEHGECADNEVEGEARCGECKCLDIAISIVEEYLNGQR